MPPQNEKVQSKTNAKNTKLQFGPNLEYMFSKSSRGLTMDNLKLPQ